jgi:kynurenine formamidase
MSGPREVYDLGRRLESTMPVSPNHPGFRMALQRRHGDVVRADGGSAANELIVLGGHTGTHLDALAHVSQDGRLFGGISAAQSQEGGRFNQLGVETVAPIVGRGILLDVAAHRGALSLRGGDTVASNELERVADMQRTDPGGAVAILIRTGWGRLWSDPVAYLGQASGVPGVDEDGARWVAAYGPRVTGADSMAYERIPPDNGHALLPAHRILLVESGIHILENLDLDRLARDGRYEFLFVCLPLPIVGATASPVRPVAVVL